MQNASILQKPLIYILNTNLTMESCAGIQCPFCGALFDIVLDTTSGSQQFTTDCEVCCRPFEVRAECEPGAVVSIEVIGS
jgi:hypothetical protein